MNQMQEKELKQSGLVSSNVVQFFSSTTEFIMQRYTRGWSAVSIRKISLPWVEWSDLVARGET